jgi:hypothetical protein
MMYGLRLEGLLLEKYDIPDEAYEAAQFAYEETGLFHEVVLVHPLAKAIND